MATLNCETINLKKGSTGKNVEILQQILKDKGYYKRQIDGDFGKYTEEAVIKLQKAQGNTPDGWFGQKTCKKLNQNSATKTKEQLINDGLVVPILERISGTKITDYKSLYNAFYKCNYVLYYNDIYTYKQELQRILNGQALNCTDFGQLALKGLKELNYKNEDLQIVRGVVTCKSGQGFGHVWCRIRINGSWINFDASAAAAHGYGLGKLICVNGYTITNINPAWAVSDDGIT